MTTFSARVRGLMAGVPLARTAAGDEQTIALAEEAVHFTDLTTRELRRVRYEQIDGVGVRGEECAVFLAGGDVIECVGPEATSLGGALARVLFAPPELLRATRAPLDADLTTQRAWGALVAPWVALRRALLEPADIPTAVRRATAAYTAALETTRATLTADAGDTPAGRARRARLDDALAPLAARGSSLDAHALVVEQSPPDELCRHWRAWRDHAIHGAAAVRDVLPAVVDALSVRDAPASSRWRMPWRRGTA
ncbi:MAG: hypothetical protein MUF00_03240 [Gemmatimonadaceae bacterium]|nr:hypothetical protein [Gemmatimonadaceae bacterium]